MLASVSPVLAQDECAKRVFSQERMRQRAERGRKECLYQAKHDSFVFDAKLVPRIFPDVQRLRADAPILIVQLIQNTWNEFASVYLAQHDGVLYGLRKRSLEGNAQNITFGRQIVDETGARKNDVMINPEDKKVSRYHAALHYGNSLKAALEPATIEFLKGTRRACAKNYCLPAHLTRAVLHFLVEPRRFYIEDLGSVLGTYVRLRPAKRVAGGDVLWIGHDLALVIGGVYACLEEFRVAYKHDQSNNQNIVFLCQDESVPCVYVKFARGEPCGQMHDLREGYVMCVRDAHACRIGDDATCNIRIPYHCLIELTVSREKDTQSLVCTARDLLYTSDYAPASLPSPPVNAQGSYFGAWKGASAYKARAERHTPRRERVQNGDVLKISSCVFKVTWVRDLQYLINDAPQDVRDNLIAQCDGIDGLMDVFANREHG